MIDGVRIIDNLYTWERRLGKRASAWREELLALDQRRTDPRPARWLRRGSWESTIRPSNHAIFFWHYEGAAAGGFPSLEIHVLDLSGKPVAIVKSE